MSKVVWILNHYAYAPDQSAGTRHYELARQIKKEGGKAIVVSCSFFHKTHSWRKGAKWKLFSRQIIEDVDFVWVWGAPYRRNGFGRILNLLSFAFLSSFYVFCKGAKGDILFASSPQPLAPYLSFILSRKKFFKVFEIRDFWPQIFIDLGAMDPSSRAAKIFFRVEKFLVSSCDIFVSNLSGAKRYCREKGIFLKRFVWVPNGVRSRYDTNNVRPARLDGDQARLKIMYTGAHGEAQNLYKVLEAANGLSGHGVEFHFLGDGTEKRALQSYAFKVGLDNVFFYDPVSTREVKSYVIAADLLLLPLIDAKIFEYGISPNKLPEYLSSGKPIIYFGPRSASPFEDGKEAIVSRGTDSMDLVDSVERFLAMSESEKEFMERGSRILMEESFLLDHSMGSLVKEMLGKENVG